MQDNLTSTGAGSEETGSQDNSVVVGGNREVYLDGSRWLGGRVDRIW